MASKRPLKVQIAQSLVDRKWYITVYSSSNGQVLMTSSGYKRVIDAKAGLKTLQDKLAHALVEVGEPLDSAILHLQNFPLSNKEEDEND